MLLCEVAGVTRHTIFNVMYHITIHSLPMVVFLDAVVGPYVQGDIPVMPTLSDVLE